MKRSMKLSVALSVASLVGSLAGSFAGSARAQDTAETLRNAVQQKAAFVRRLLDDSPAAKRIQSSPDVQARSLFAAAQEQHRTALARLDSGDLAGADRLLNDAIWSAGRARQLVPDPMNRVITDRVEYARLVAGVEALRASYLRHLPRAQGRVGMAPTADTELERVDALIEDARSLASAESFAQAIRVVQDAERGLVNGLTKLLGSSTLVYAERFETLQEEYAYELDRNRSYEELVPVAVSEMRPSADALRVVGRFVERNQALREQAQALAGRKDIRGALKTLRSGTEQLQRALANAGVIVPTALPTELPGEPR